MFRNERRFRKMVRGRLLRGNKREAAKNEEMLESRR